MRTPPCLIFFNCKSIKPIKLLLITQPLACSSIPELQFSEMVFGFAIYDVPFVEVRTMFGPTFVFCKNEI